jgi:argininosuccinate lyase
MKKEKPLILRLSDKKKSVILIKEAERDLNNDKVLIPYEILTSEAHIVMLNKVGILDLESTIKILKMLEAFYEKWSRNNIQLNPELEDIHFNIESYLINKLGIRIGGKLHTARSRNDLIATDMRLYLRDLINHFSQKLLDAIERLLSIAERNVRTIIPGYTHMQQAQPITLSHYLIAQADQLLRSYQRLRESYERVNLSPLGAGALAGVNWPIDRELTAKLLGFSGIIENSLDAINSRGEIEIELLSDLAIIATQLSRIAEDLIFWSTQESGLIELDDAYAGVSSIMPQKKNPEAAEIIRAKASEIYGKLIGALTLMKGLPTGYNKDMQELKSIIRESFETIELNLEAIVNMIDTMKIKNEAFLKSPTITYTLATDIADILVKNLGISFREAHQIIATAVRLSQGKGLTPDYIIIALSEILGLKDYDLSTISFNPEISIMMKASKGSTNPDENIRMLTERKNIILQERNKLNAETKRIDEALFRLKNEVNKLINSYNELINLR